MSFDQNHIATVSGYAGKAVRYSFYVAGTVAFALIAIGAVRVSSFFGQPSSVSTKASFQIASSDLARLPPATSSAKFNGGWQEVLQYGRIYDRDTDFTMVVNMPANPGTPVVRDYSSEMSSLRPLLRSTSYMGAATYYDLQTRFGPVRAASFQANSDGQIKLCVSYLSRFDTDAVYLKGWLCEASGARPNFHALACLLDRVTVKGVLPTAAAQNFFEERMKRPGRCSAEPVSQTTDTRPPRPPRRL
ncbi:hypothetical protein [Bradyrhizobium sp. G127]|uniref:hypothetical protein n=1 Tax=Bradyrhizobium sp. G127 TaxID=2904800 RepID=UPI001F2C53DD|nr:hypothetical protein [Bradyrhizobium sp. G127]MCF2521418.1 hypothetical protein [Bradyrhizobium sp. G127]